MKKQLLAGAFVLASFLTAQAQVSYSFETSEGFVLGDFVTDENGTAQNNWTGDTPFAQIVNTAATDGDNSLLLGTNNTALEGGATIGVYGPDFTNVSGDQVSFSFDIQLPTLDATGGSSVMIAAQAPSQELATSRVLSLPDGRFVYYDIDPDNPQNLAGLLFGTYDAEADVFTPFIGTAGTWYNIQVLHDFAVSNEDFPDGAIGYFIDGVQLGVSSAWGATAVENVIFQTDNLSTTALFDNIIVDGSETAGVKENNITSLAVTPNPASDFVNITNNENALVNGVVITDLNGRTVKTAKFAGVAQAQVNVSDLASGVYMMTISSDKGSVTKKIVKN